jgi:hypothetical protein
LFVDQAGVRWSTTVETGRPYHEEILHLLAHGKSSGYHLKNCLSPLSARTGDAQPLLEKARAAPRFAVPDDGRNVVKEVPAFYLHVGDPSVMQ